MSQINSTELLKGMRDNAKVQNLESVPSQLADKVVPVMETNPILLRKCNISKGLVSSASGTIYTTPTDRDFYIVASCLSVVRDASATSVSTRILATIDGLASPILGICGVTLTAGSSEQSISFPTPIKVDRGTNITVSFNTATAVITAYSQITGYLVD